jgi:hypothetical protein
MGQRPMLAPDAQWLKLIREGDKLFENKSRATARFKK